MAENYTHSHVWTITEAKARLSEMLRQANDEPQDIGVNQTHVVVSAEAWHKVQSRPSAMGPWLIEALQGTGNLELPDRSCLLYTSPSPRDLSTSRMPSSA